MEDLLFVALDTAGGSRHTAPNYMPPSLSVADQLRTNLSPNKLGPPHHNLSLNNGSNAFNPFYGGTKFGAGATSPQNRSGGHPGVPAVHPSVRPNFMPSNYQFQSNNLASGTPGSLNIRGPYDDDDQLAEMVM